MKIGNLEVYGIIYKIKNNKNNKVYIGQTIYPFNLRYSNKGIGIERVYRYHKSLKENEYGYNPHLLSSIEKYGFDSFDVNEMFDFAFSKEELNIKERIWIKIYDSFRNGYNRNIGGEGNSGFDGLKGADNPMSRKVIQLSLEGEFIKKWEFMADAERELGLKTRISAACTGEKKSIGGFMWKYEEDYLKNKDNINPYKSNIGDYNKKSVIQLDLEGNFINRFNSISEAAKSINKNNSKIQLCCSKKRKSAYGFMWIEEQDYLDGNIPIYDIGNRDSTPTPIVRLTLNGEFVDEFESGAEAGRILGISASCIRGCAAGRRKSYKGYVYMIKEDYEKNGARIYKKETPIPREILALDLNYQIIKEYNSINEAARDTGIASKQISEQIRNPLVNPKNIIWVRKEEYNKVYNT